MDLEINKGYKLVENEGYGFSLYIDEGIKEITSLSLSSTFDQLIIPEQITDIVFPESLEVIKDNAFKGFSSLESLEFPESLKKIGHNVFFGCTHLEAVKLNNNLEEIGEYAFAKCGIKELDVPSSVIRIRSSAFMGNSFLDKVNFQNDNIIIESYAFSRCYNLKDIGDITFSECCTNSFENCPLDFIKIKENGLYNIMMTALKFEEETFPITVSEISHASSCPLNRKYYNETGTLSIYKIKNNKFELDYNHICETTYHTQVLIRYIVAFIREPNYFNLKNIPKQDKEDKVLLAFAYKDYDKKFTDYARNNMDVLLHYIGETKDYELLDCVLNSKLIGKRMIDKYLDMIAAGNYEELFLSLVQYKSKELGYNDKNERFNL